ncbi:unnamed protein product [Blepharisma stoltei]|uniref:Palmitoyltransferase n=1 Tax=Blepharisma stoltei TaxID=1481888 RepID=A0AAU9IPV4_9CILI|nr:unnamed protein product [Blepharisma stoltei]
MGFWLFSIYMVISVSFLFVLLCVNPHGTGPLSYLSRFFYVKLPAFFDRISLKILGPMGKSKISYYALYIFNRPNPFFQLTYLSLSLGGYYIFYAQAFPFIPNPLVPAIHMYLGSIMYLLALCTFFAACWKSPGKVTQNNYKKYLSLFPYDNILFKENSCTTCKLQKPARSKHCSVCEGCVPKMDHHCVWINQCVGYGNYKFFLAFLLSHSVICLYASMIGFMIFAYITLSERLFTTVFTDREGNRVSGSWIVVFQYLIQEHQKLFFAESLCLVVGILLGGFFLYHLLLVKNNTTSNERMKRLDLQIDDKKAHLLNQPNIYNRGFLKNLEEVIDAEPF